MNILFVYELYAPHVGGGEVSIQHLAEGLVKRGHTVHLVTLLLPGTNRHERMNGVLVERVKTPHRLSRYWFLLCAVPTIWRFSQQADVIHTSTYTAALPAWLVARLRRKPIVLTVHEVWGKLWQEFSGLHPLSAKLHQWFERWVFCFPFNNYIVASKFTQDKLISLDITAQKVHLVQHGIDSSFAPQPIALTQQIRSRLDIPREHFLVLFFGRPGVSKGVEYLMASLPDLLQRIPGSHVILLLARKPETGFHQIMKLWQLLVEKERVHILPPVDRDTLPAWIGAANVVIVPSLSEGFGFSVAEACAVGTPVVATRVGSIPEVVSGKFVLIEAKNPQAIVQGVEEVWHGQFTQTPIHRFSWDTPPQLLEKIYSDLLQH